MPLIVITNHHHYYDEKQRQQHAVDIPLLQQTMEKLMAQIDDLMAILGPIHDDVTALLEKAQNLEAQLTQLQQSTPPQVDLQPAIDAATAIRQQLEGTATATASATGADAPNTSTTSETVTASDSASADVTSSATPGDGSAAAPVSTQPA